ncbi:MAG TPA: MFS transporter [bacterium]|nr:MFS transporter [bacterium]
MTESQSSRSPATRLGFVHFLLESQFWFPIWVVFLLQKDFTLGQIVIADMVFRSSIVILEVPLGIVGDRIGRKKTYFLGALFAAITYFVFTITTSFILLLICWVLWAFFWSLISGTNTAYRYEILALDSGHSGSIRIFGYFNSIAAAALLISHTTAGYLYGIHPALPIWFNVVFSIIAAVLILTLPSVQSQVQSSASNYKKMLQSLVKLIKENSSILPLIGIMALWTAYHWTPTLVFQPLMQELGLPKRSFGLVFAIFTGMGILSGIITGRLAQIFGNLPIIISSLILQVAAVACTAFGGNLFVILAGIVILRFAYNLSEPILAILLNREIDNSIRASMISIVNLLASLIMILSRPLVGLVAAKYSVATSFQVWFFVGIIFIPVSIIFINRVKP